MNAYTLTAHATAALLVCFGCGGTPDAHDRAAPETSGVTDMAVPARDDVQSSSSAFLAPPPSEERGVVVARGQLETSFLRPARADVCITLGEDGRVLGMDEFICEPLNDDANGPVAYCEGCVLG